MYNLSYFKDNDLNTIKEFINQHPFAFIVGCDAKNRPVATQIPIFIEEDAGKIFLRGHFMKGTDHHRAFEQNANVLVVFNGSHCYVSATWYTDPHQASTWNYMSVHARGMIRLLGEEALISILRKTSLHFENHNRNSSTAFDNLGPDYVKRLMKAIVAFEIEVTEMDNVFKLSQNRDEKSYNTIIEKLSEQGGGAAAIAEEMNKRKGRLFPRGSNT